MAKPFLIKRRCPAQEQMCLAIAACQAGVIHYVSDENEPLGGRIVFDLARCDGCGKCATACCGKAIEMR